MSNQFFGDLELVMAAKRQTRRKLVSRHLGTARKLLGYESLDPAEVRTIIECADLLLNHPDDLCGTCVICKGT